MLACFLRRFDAFRRRRFSLSSFFSLLYFSLAPLLFTRLFAIELMTPLPHTSLSATPFISRFSPPLRCRSFLSPACRHARRRELPPRR